jgi:hypothetical protein
MSRRRCFNLVLIVLILLVGGATPARAEGFPAKDLPREGKSLEDFLPRGWVVEEQVQGDLTGDGVTDLAAILIEDKPDDDENGTKNERQRGLIILVSQGKERLMLAGSNARLLRCTTCGGVKGGVTIELKKGVIIVGQLIGSRGFTDETLRFRYDPQTRRFVLIGRDIETGDSVLGTGKIESFNTLTGLKITETYRYDRKGDRKITISSKKEKGPRNTRFFDEVEAGY